MSCCLAGRVLAASWPRPGRVLAASWPCPGRILVTSWRRPGRALAAPWLLPPRVHAASPQPSPAPSMRRLIDTYPCCVRTIRIDAAVAVALEPVHLADGLHLRVECRRRRVEPVPNGALRALAVQHLEAAERRLHKAPQRDGGQCVERDTEQLLRHQRP
eukprot:CAMPEP_0119403168 /NCGR_PEP_ID=MMETSP1334-20130426/143248_1 /TAXON_ID=127549 /ORGANISM="Calcidiscus leptoporus, Strain RCC1130" /LENGTH=158 /DNA_ID=CAMNT_0007427109 /DNA_START=391 /DNA_END=862 /DNA_ORIENTATION=-